jgi:hypothetical protein
MPAIMLEGARVGGGRKNLGDYRLINGHAENKNCLRTLRRVWPSRRCPLQSPHLDVRQADRHRRV